MEKSPTTAPARAGVVAVSNEEGVPTALFFLCQNAHSHPVSIGTVVSAQDLHTPGKYIYLCNRRVACCIAYKVSVERKV